MRYYPFVVGAWLFVLGLYGIVAARDMVRQVICLAVVQSSSYVLLLSVGYKAGAAAPIYKDIPAGTNVVDPVVQALALTDTVVEATVIAARCGLRLKEVPVVMRQRVMGQSSLTLPLSISYARSWSARLARGVRPGPLRAFRVTPAASSS